MKPEDPGVFGANVGEPTIPELVLNPKGLETLFFGGKTSPII